MQNGGRKEFCRPHCETLRRDPDRSRPTPRTEAGKRHQLHVPMRAISMDGRMQKSGTGNLAAWQCSGRCGAPRGQLRIEVEVTVLRGPRNTAHGTVCRSGTA